VAKTGVPVTFQAPRQTLHAWDAVYSTQTGKQVAWVVPLRQVSRGLERRDILPGWLLIATELTWRQE
jgi:hypothetical protein